MRFLSWLSVVFSRVVMWILQIPRFPLALAVVVLSGAAGFLQGVNDWIADIQRDIRNACPWPWIAEFRNRWEFADHSERKRIMRALRDAE